MSAADSGRPACPVCGLTITGQPECPECGWTWRTPLTPGTVTARLRAEFDTRLNAARRAVDARAAALISADRDRYEPYIRGGRPDDAEWASARRAAAAAAAGGVSEQRLRAALADALIHLADSEVAIADVGPEGITVATVGLDALGSPQLRRELMRWPDLAPELSGDPDERRLQLAGALHGADREGLWKSVGNAIPAAVSTARLVICRPAGWPVLEQAADLAGERAPAARRLRAVASATGQADPAAMLDALVREAPLTRSYGMVMAVIDGATGLVRREVHPLFAPGDRPGQEAVVSARRLPGAGGEVTLAVLAKAGRLPRPAPPPGHPAGEPLLACTVPLPAVPLYRIRILLEGPGRVRIIEPPGAVPLTRPWAEILNAVPPRVQAAPEPVDLVCAIELAGLPAEVDRRVRLVRDLLTALGSDFPTPELMRVSVLGCTDHILGQGREARRVIFGAPLASVGEARASLAELAQRAAQVHYVPAAPLEDMLQEAAVQLAGSRRLRRAPRLLLVAKRPPHPYPQDGNPLLPCPRKLKWRAEMHRLTVTCGARCVVTVDSLPSGRRAAAIWQDLGPTAQRELTSTDARQIGEDLGILVPHSQRMPIPLANPE